MPEPEEVVSPESEGNLEGKPEDGNPTAEEGELGSPEDNRPSYDDLEKQVEMLKKNYGDSSREAQRLSQQLQMTQQQMQQMQWQMSQNQQPTQRQVEQFTDEHADYMSEADSKKLNEALLDNDVGTVNRIMTGIATRARDDAIKAVQANWQAENAKAQRISQPLRELMQNKELADANHPLTQQTIQNYQRMAQEYYSGSNYQYLPNETVPFGGAQVNPYLLREAFREAKLVVGKPDLAQKERNKAGDGYVEPALKGQASPGGKQTDGIILSDAERELAKRYGITAKKYWENLSEDTKAERRKRGKPVTVQHRVAIG